MGRTDRASLLLHVDSAAAFAALTDADALLAWLPPAGMDGKFERFDMRVGGSYRLVLTYRDASDAPGKTSASEDVSGVRITDLVPGERVVQEVDFESDDPAFHGTMQMEWSTRAVEEGTIVEVVARNVPGCVSARDHAAGLRTCLASAHHLASQHSADRCAQRSGGNRALRSVQGTRRGDLGIDDAV